MATPSTVVWDRDAHTGAKHDLLRRYLLAWLPILFTTHQKVTYAEGFAGPGVYTGREAGSPVIALEVIAAHRELLAMHPHRIVEMLFIEADRRRCDRLEQELAVAKKRLGAPPGHVRVYPPVCGDCAVELLPQLTKLASWDSPMFVVLDSFGGPDIPFAILKQVAKNNSGEVLVTFGPTFLTRHGGNPHHGKSGDQAFGGQRWRGVFDQPPDRKWSYLVEAYRTSMHQAGFAHILGFEMVDERGSQVWLMFGTNHLRGIEKMKDAMWRVDPAYGVRYRDPRDPDQMALDIADVPDTAPLSRMLLEVMAKGARSLDELRHYALLETVYRPQQVRGVVQRLLADGRLTRTPGHLGGDTTLSIASTSPRSQERQGALFDL